ncbi:hypothetical protein C8R46DRAFT_1223521 [Mycena filopes]|nr:hypothetical protein C8R46DRAFT_1223521 [Mycena filopes]
MLSHLQADRVRASALGAQIRDLERALSILRAAKVLVQDRLDSYKYPVLTLPNEIISRDILPLPATLTTPILWRAIDLTSTDAPFPRQLDQFDIWLTRSGCCPISLEIGEGQSNFSLAQSARWEVLKIALALTPLPIVATSMPALCHLDVAINDGDVGDESTVFGGAPLLRSVILNDVAAREIILPWAQLTSLRLDRVYPSECAPVLQQTPNLIHCHLALVRQLPPDPCPRVTLLHLESLFLLPYDGEDWAAPELADYMQTFVVPALRHFTTSERFLENPIHALTSFIWKSGCNLREIAILWARSISPSVYRKAFPSIQLSLDGVYASEDDIDDAGSEHVL